LYTWAATGLPTGLSINPSTGEISGSPSASGTFTVSVTSTDSAVPPLATRSALSLTVASDAPPVPPVTVPPAPVTTTTTTIAPSTVIQSHVTTVCTPETKKVRVDVVKVRNGKRVTVVELKTVRVYKTVTIKKVEKIKGKKVTVISHKRELAMVCRSVVVT